MISLHEFLQSIRSDARTISLGDPEWEAAVEADLQGYLNVLFRHRSTEGNGLEQLMIHGLSDLGWDVLHVLEDTGYQKDQGWQNWSNDMF